MIDRTPRGAALLGQYSEEEVLDTLLALLPTSGGKDVGPGDDGAVLSLSGPLIATTDSMVRGTDWRDDWSSPADVASKCLTQNLADVAAMGAQPRSVLLSLVADPATPFAWVVDFARAFGQAARRAGVDVAGGDLSGAPSGTLMLSVTAFGQLAGQAPVLRSGAQPGDVVALAGTLGMSGAGLLLLQSRSMPDQARTDSALIAAHLSPRAPIEQGPVAAAAGAHAMIDISDGLLRDADRIGRASGVLVDLRVAALAPFAHPLTEALSADDALECVLTGGEEHSLLACFPDGMPLPPGWQVIGRIRPGLGVALDGEPAVAAGWDHFAG
ncbi:MAG: thiamine-phosphate kinase [Nostocoides sp.]